MMKANWAEEKTVRMTNFVTIGAGVQRILYCTVNTKPLTGALSTLFNYRSLGGSIGPPPSSFETLHLVDLKFGKFNKFHLYFQLSVTT